MTPYVPGDSPVHRCRPGRKILLLVGAGSVLFAWPRLDLALAALGLAGLLYGMAGIPARLVLDQLRPLAWILAVLVLVQLALDGWLAGLLVAGIGVWASHALGDPRLDGIASIVIGGILAAVAVLLAREAKGLLIGERADPATIARIRQMVGAHPGISTVNHVRTVHTAPDAVFVAISADFDDALTMGEAEPLVERIEAELRETFPSLKSIYIRPERHDDAPAGFAPPRSPGR